LAKILVERKVTRAMKEIRIHGRGGQGNVAAAEILSVAAFADGRYAQAFPAFGAERTGAPVQAFVRLGDEPIRVRSQVYNPDYVIVQDSTLLSVVDVVRGLKPGGTLLLNVEKGTEQIELDTDATVFGINATDIAIDLIGRPVPNTTLLGAFAALSGEVSLEAMQNSVRERFGGKPGAANARAVAYAYEVIKAGGCNLRVIKSNGTTRDAGSKVLHVNTHAFMASPGTSLNYMTGTWRSNRPVFKQEKCTGCGICLVYCPEGVIYKTDKKKYGCDFDYCKGCGICAEECPVDDIDMVKEEASK
jgi:pyruvate ferredoxin oxidoreductase gamma subunit